GRRGRAEGAQQRPAEGNLAGRQDSQELLGGELLQEREGRDSETVRALGARRLSAPLVEPRVEDERARDGAGRNGVQLHADSPVVPLRRALSQRVPSARSARFSSAGNAASTAARSSSSSDCNARWMSAVPLRRRSSRKRAPSGVTDT